MNETKEHKQFSFKDRFLSFIHAWDGLKVLLREEYNARIHIFVTIVVLLTAAYFQISSLEWCAILLSIALVLCAEISNSAIERICDLIHPEEHIGIKKIKDIMAGCVALSAAISIIVGLIIFGPRILQLLKH